MWEYRGLDSLPRGQADDNFIHGCAVFEGGGWRGVYTQGVIDELMIQGINLDCSAGVSAGALMSVNYLTGQIGRGPYITLKYRHDSRFVGWQAFRDNQGITGFKFMHEDVDIIWPPNNDRYYRTDLRHVCVATDMHSGEARYFEKGVDENWWSGVRAGATVPFLSKPVVLDGVPYLDGGVADPIPVMWALSQGYEKVLVVKTRVRGWRQKKDYSAALCNRLYHNYPRFNEELKHSSIRVNKTMDRIDRLEAEGRIFVICPSRQITIPVFSGNMERLGQLYELGREDTREAAANLRRYLGLGEE